MPNCSICGQPIDKLPNWLDDVSIPYRCAACAEQTTQAIAAQHAIEADEDAEEEAAAVQDDDDDEDEAEEEEE